MDKIHPTSLETTVPSEELGRQIMALRYDLVLEVLKGMLQECNRQAAGDAEVGRERMSERLKAVSLTIEDLIDDMSVVVRLCRPYIEKERADGDHI